MSARDAMRTRPPVPPVRRRDRWSRLARSTVVALVAVVVFAAVTVVASAAGLGGLQSGDLSAGDAAVAECDADGFTYDFTLSTGLVTAVVVGDIADPGCEGGTLHLTLVDDVGNDVGTGTESIGVDSDTDPDLITVSLSVQPLLTEVSAIHAVVVGP